MKSLLVCVLTAALAARQASAQTPTASQAVEQPSEAPKMGGPTVQGCFKSAGTMKVLVQNLDFNTIGKCTDKCKAKNKKVGASRAGAMCYCGDEYPPLNTITKDTDCNSMCPGFGEQACGGAHAWTVYNVGIGIDVDYSPNVTESTSTSATQSPTASATKTSAPAVVTESSKPDKDESSSGSNTAGIAAGVVVAVVAVAGIAGGLLYFFKRRRNQEIEEEHRRNAAINNFINGSKPGSSGGLSMTDARLDPVVMSQRRLSDGSIADNQDYSRKILRVTNA